MSNPREFVRRLQEIEVDLQAACRRWPELSDLLGEVSQLSEDLDAYFERHLQAVKDAEDVKEPL